MSRHWGVAGLTVRRAGRAVLDRVDLELAPGTVTVVVGGDGAGKTTLLRVLAGAVRADAGSVRRPAADRLGTMIEVPAVYHDLSVDEHVAFVAAVYGVDDRDRVAELLRRAGLSAARRRLGGQLSGGMRQKLAVVLAMLHRPDLVLLDEPTTGVDPVSRAELWRLVSHAAAEGAAVLLSTTYLDEGERAVQTCVLHEGRVLLVGHPDELLAGATGAFGLSDTAAEGLPAWRHGRTWRLWAPDGVLPSGVRREAATMEDLVITAQLGRAEVAQR